VPSPPSCYRHAFRRSTFQSPFGARGKARTNSRSPSKTAEATQAAIGSANRRLPVPAAPQPVPRLSSSYLRRHCAKPSRTTTPCWLLASYRQRFGGCLLCPALRVNVCPPSSSRLHLQPEIWSPAKFRALPGRSEPEWTKLNRVVV
jgi:hypothetical protein